MYSIKLTQDCIKVETHNCLVKQDKHKQVISTWSVVYLCASPYMGISWQLADRKHTIFGSLLEDIINFACIHN